MWKIMNNKASKKRINKKQQILESKPNKKKNPSLKTQ